jgi:4-amino-4-deoxy-L-arabinose transferase-like glycosyltransferase
LSLPDEQLSEPAAAPEAPRAARGATVEVAVAAAVLVFCWWFGRVTGWQGPPKTSISTAIWPFYLDTWFPTTIWTGRLLAPLAGAVLASLVLRAWMREEQTDDTRVALLVGLTLAAYVVHLGCGLQRFGLEWGLKKTFARTMLEYWGDLPLVRPGFLAAFPEVGRLSQHGETHPPGATLLLAGIRALGFVKGTPALGPSDGGMDAALFCSTAGVLSAFPLYGAARRLAGDAVARLALPLFLFAGSVIAYSVLAMDAWTMLFASLSLWGLACTLEPRGDGRAPIAAGALWGLGLAAATFFTFAAAMLALSYAIVIASRARALDRRRLVGLAAGPLAFLAFYAVLVVGFGYRPLHVFAACAAKFALSDDSRRVYARTLLGSPVAYLGALGLPLMALTGRAIGGAALRLWRRDDLRTVALVLGGVAPAALCTLLGRPRGEVEHVYLLFVPLTVLGAAAAAHRWYGRGDRWLRWFAVPALAAQAILVEVYVDTMW